MSARNVLSRHSATRLSTSTLAALGGLGIATRQVRRVLAGEGDCPAESLQGAQKRVTDAELIFETLSMRGVSELATSVKLSDGTNVIADLDCVLGATGKLLQILDVTDFS